MFEARIVADSICNGQRLTTMQVTFPHIILAEWNTHCMFARNTSSSRAIPFTKMIKRVIESPFIPIHWGCNQSGMQAFTELEGKRRQLAIDKWLEARDEAVRIAREMAADKCLVCGGIGKVYGTKLPELRDIDLFGTGTGAKSAARGEEFPCPECEGDGLGLNVHKQIVNRLIEAWMWTTNCTTGDAGAWSNFFALRCEKDAEPHMQKIAYMAQKAYFESTPEVLEPGDWHTPYIRDEEIHLIAEWVIDRDVKTKLLEFKDAMVQISVGRCARTSYLTQEGTRDFAKDIELHDRLRYHTPLHASPFEHVCVAMGDGQRYAKYVGWKAYRHMLDREYVTDFKPNHPELTGDLQP